MKQQNEYIEANRAMWNDTAPVHAEAYVNKLMERIGSADYTRFDDVEKRIFAEIDLAGKDVIQLGCNNGRELIAIKKVGAARCVGVDISDAFLEQAQQLAAAAGVDVEWVRSSYYDVGEQFDGQFDLVYISIGVFGWLPDLDGFLDLVARVAKPGGQLFIYEMHPILDMFSASTGLLIDSSYFRTEPFEDADVADYMDPTKTVSAVSYWFHHKLSDVLGGLIRRGFNLTHFEEYGHDISNEYASFEHFDKKPPLCYSLVARKQ